MLYSSQTCLGHVSELGIWQSKVLSDIAEVIIWNSIRLMKNIEFGSQVDGWLEWSVIYTRKRWEECRC